MKATIIIEVEVDEETGQGKSTHQIEGMHPFDAGIILIEVGRDLIRTAYLALERHHDEHERGEELAVGS